MENQKSLERVVSQKALQMGSSFPCQICVVGFLCGVCIASLILAALTSMGFSGFSSPFNSTSHQFINVVTSRDCEIRVVETNRLDSSETSRNQVESDQRVSLLHSAWTAALSESINESFETLRLNKSPPPNAPHLENCKSSQKTNQYLDTRTENGTFPPWTIWRGPLGMHRAATATDQLKQFRQKAISDGPYPPWVSGSDEENYPLTRKVQRDIWIHQHPVDCRDPNVRFLVAEWERLPGFGIGAQLAGMCGLLAIAIKEKRVLVTSYYNRADHDGCKGSSRSSWSCYFFPETSQECRDRAFKLMKDAKARETGIVTTKDDYKSKEIWSGKTPRKWGEPWSYMQPTTDINGSLITSHRKMDRRWWRAQAIRYLMRFQTEYTCNLMNIARNEAFGEEVAKMVLESIGDEWPKEKTEKTRSEIEEYVWSNYEKPWIPRPMLSMHVRMGDKACEMKVVEFEEYMRLADRIRNRFPHLKRIWLSTEMQEVIDKSKEYKKWKFYYSKVTRQVGNITMAKYETSLGRKMSTNYPLVNFIMATEADFFIGALGSTWCFLIDGMRNTGGKVMAGYLSVNKDRFW